MIEGLKVTMTGEELRALERPSKVTGEMTMAHFALAERSHMDE